MNRMAIGVLAIGIITGMLSKTFGANKNPSPKSILPQSLISLKT